MKSAGRPSPTKRPAKRNFVISLPEKLPFGKFRGQSIPAVESWYLRWLLQQEWVRRRYGLIATAAQDELKRRDESLRRALARPRDDVLVIDRSAFGRWFRKLTAKYHPDRTGDSAIMVALNNARDELLQLAAGERA